MFTVPFFVPLFAVFTVITSSITVYKKVHRNVLEERFSVSSLPIQKSMLLIFERFRDTMPSWLKKYFMPNNTLDEMIRKSGLSISSEEFVAVRFVTAGLMLVMILLAAGTKISWFLLPAAIIVVPDWWLRHLVTERRKKMDREFLFVASRLAAALSGGLTLNKALEWASKGFEYGGKKSMKSPLRKEIEQCVRQSEMGFDFDEILNGLADRTGLINVKRMVLHIMNARRGVSVAESLQEAVDMARETRLKYILGQAKTVEDKAEVALFIMALPTMILTLAPMGIQMIQQGFLGGGGI